MSDNVIRLATINPHANMKACQDCRFFHPDTGTWGWSEKRFFLWGKDIPSANAIRYAKCGHAARFAMTYRAVCRGDFWEAKE